MLIIVLDFVMHHPLWRLLEMIGSGAVSNQVADVAEADSIIVIGANPTVNHPVAATFIKNAAKAGKNLIVLDPRKNDLSATCNTLLTIQTRH